MNKPVTVEWDASAWAIIGAKRLPELRWSQMNDHIDWRVRRGYGKHTFRNVSGNPLGFRKGPRGGTYIVYADREIRIRPYWVNKLDG